MAAVHLYEPDEALRSNIVEMLDLQGHTTNEFGNFERFIAVTQEKVPELAICSLINRNDYSCKWERYLLSILSSNLMTIGIDPACTCCINKIRLGIPFTDTEFLECLEQCLGRNSNPIFQIGPAC